jgi:hypothetical protein
MNGVKFSAYTVRSLLFLSLELPTSGCHKLTFEQIRKSLV